MTQHYELVYLVKVSTKPEDIKLLEKTTTDYISKHGTLLKSGDLGKRKLAYEINHESHALYWLFDFNLATDALAELHRMFTLNEHVIRFLIVATKQKTQEQIEREEKMKESAERQRMKKQQEDRDKVREKEEKDKKEKQAKMPEIPKEKLSLDELDKKLDELLDDDSLT